TPDDGSEYESAPEQEKSQEKATTDEEAELSGDATAHSQSEESGKTVPLDEEENMSEENTVAD
ncbi:hypothetical protein A2U01_0091214, partial [Trifolium medium]|nr:hypothetical protein [Trifolium medium]